MNATAVSSGIARSPARHAVAPPAAERATRVTGGRTRLLRGLDRRDAMRRLSRAELVVLLLPSVGPFDGATCTAVTLYSGQLVAQSE